MTEPTIQVGILLEQQKIDFALYSDFRFNQQRYGNGDFSVSFSLGKIEFENKLYDEIVFETENIYTSKFELKNVIIGVWFHWERKENQLFSGKLKFIVENNAISAINILPLEDYLKSVISSEMSATSSVELLKAHAVISRSWLLAQIQKTEKLDKHSYQTSLITDDEIVRWYDREDHTNFDVCADDHCQRYQGITRQTTELVGKVIDNTRGEVLKYNDLICDARFSKCCGGAMEVFENVWEPVNHPYLQGKPDLIDEKTPLPDLTIEQEAEKWIRSSPPAFCNTNNVSVLKQVLNDYDQETADFFRWRVEYTQQKISALIKKKSGVDFGKIIDLQPVERGTSGRLKRLRIIGTNRTMVIGKELEIRRTLSESHLYSSAFVVDKEDVSQNGVPQKFILTGCGWGHGVGLCQIGAATMAEKNFSYQEMLEHYFPNSKLEKLYK